MNKAAAYKVIGQPEPRNDGEEKATGKGVYTVDVKLPGMAYGKILRSPYAHARLKQIDASKAEKLPGVFAVITREDQKSISMFGAAYKDQTIVAVDKVRYVGDPVAAVAAVDEAVAEEALGLIEVEYEELPAVTSIDEALAPGAPLVHESSASGGELMGEHYETPKEFSGSNLCYRFSYNKGDAETAFKKADHTPAVLRPHRTSALICGQ
jgi:CO/xanthine dehydrogenase Mo-binding subunit